MQRLKEGMPLEGGKVLVPVYADLASLDQAEDRLRIVVKDGRSREVSLLLEHVGAAP
jgi:16S rRNA U516 pseudouridylate synthase RsuA-like enzyme